MKKHAYANVETNDLYQAFQDTLGVTPGWFFDEWLYRGGEPHYQVSWREISESDKEYVSVKVEQIHLRDDMTGLFKMPIVIEVYGADGLQNSERAWIEQQTTEIKIPKHGKPTFVLFDPGSWIIKKMTFKKPYEELKAQALGAPLMIDRYDAVVAMKDDSTNITDKERVFEQIFNKEKFQAIKSEIIQQLAGKTTDISRSIIKRALSDADADIRKSALNSMKGVPVEFKLEVEKLLRDSSYQIITTALDKLCETFPADAPRYLSQTADEVGMFAQVLLKWREISALRGEKQSFSILADLSGNAYEFRTRQLAFNSLKKVNYCDETVAENLFDAMINPNTRLAGSAKSLLEYFYEQSQFKQIIKQKFATTNWTASQKDIIEPSIK